MPQERLAGSRAVVVDIDGDVDAVPVPADIVQTVERNVPADDQARSLEVIALYFARLGPVAADEVRRQLAKDPSYFASVPPEVLDLVRNHPERLERGD